MDTRDEAIAIKFLEEGDEDPVVGKNRKTVLLSVVGLIVFFSVVIAGAWFQGPTDSGKQDASELSPIDGDKKGQVAGASTEKSGPPAPSGKIVRPTPTGEKKTTPTPEPTTAPTSSPTNTPAPTSPPAPTATPTPQPTATPTPLPTATPSPTPTTTLTPSPSEVNGE